MMYSGVLHNLIYIRLHSSSEAVQGSSRDATGAGARTTMRVDVKLLTLVLDCRYHNTTRS